ncbi:MAG: chemotaxis protein CheB [Alphaproteobacteria bacterium]|nr:chemotaxis protein CheB [Alphaproteobacteria bacterium]
MHPHRCDVIVIGASAGGVEALIELCRTLPGDIPASIFIVQHMSPRGTTVLPQLLTRAGALPVTVPQDGEAIRRSHVYLAPPDHHLLVRPGHTLIRRGPHENRSRPSVDALFRSAAIAYGPRTIGVVLSGLLDDGTDGLIAIKAAGGISVVQDPADATWASMPLSALARDHVDHCVPMSRMSALLCRLARAPAGPRGELPAETLAEARIAEQEVVAVPATAIEPPGKPSPLACPECGGVLNQIPTEADNVRFRCQVGHAFTAEGLVEAQNDELERALAIAVRTHRDRMRLFQTMEATARDRNLPHAAERWAKAASESERLANVLGHAIDSLRRLGEQNLASAPG